MVDFFRDKWRSWIRNARTLVCDVSFNRNLRILGVIVVLSVICFVVLWCLGVGIKAELYNQDGSRHALTFHEYLFSILGAIDADPDAAPVYAMYSAFVRLVGAILIGGVLTSFLCSLLARFSDMTLRGLLVPSLSNHVVIVGYTPLTDDLIRMLLSESEKNSFDKWYPYGLRQRKKKGKILLYTSGDVQSIRDTLNSVLDSDMERRIVYAFGDMDMTNGTMAEEVCQKLSLLRAQSVIILGDACDPGRGDLKNLAFASVAGGYVRRHRINAHKKEVERMEEPELERLRFDSENIPIPFYVQMDDISTFGLIKHMEYKIGSKALSGEVSKREGGSDQSPAWESISRIDLGSMGAYIRPFSYYEGWARAIWGAPYPLIMPKRPETPPTGVRRLISKIFKSRKLEREKPEVNNVEEPRTLYYPLDFRPMEDESRVHLVVAGLSSMGEALVIEAIRICHYPNGKNTIITVIDSNPDAEVDFRVHHPEVFTLKDISIEFRCERLQSESARSFLAGLAQDRNCILTVAICFRNIESTMFEGLCLPSEVYQAYEDPLLPDGKKRPNHVAERQSYSKYPPRVLVYQEHVNGNPEDGESSLPVRYKFVRPFGMQEQGLQTRCMRSFASMYLNAVFFWPLDADGKSFVEPIRESGILSASPELENRFDAFAEKWRIALAAGKQSEIPAEERFVLLRDILSLNDSVLEYFKKYAFRRFIMMEPVKEWGNVYVPDSYGTILRSIGLEAELPSKETKGRTFNERSAADFRKLCVDNEREFTKAIENPALKRSKSLEEVEHLRWMADRALMGYRLGKERDDGYRYHNAMCSYSGLSDADKNKDALVIRFIPLFLALEGLKIKPMG